MFLHTFSSVEVAKTLILVYPHNVQTFKHLALVGISRMEVNGIDLEKPRRETKRT
jgi:hypothetical protein